MKESIHQFYSQPPEIRHKQKLNTDDRITIGRQARDGLMKVFRNKCAYCESDLQAVFSGEIDRFRPYTDASDLSGKGSPDHYAWLSVEWDNLYIACPACARAKRSLFPVEGKRADVLTPLDVVREIERPLLIDPCFDDPAIHLSFVETGYVEALTIRGETTIKVLNLNRQGLVRARHDVWRLARVTAEVTDDPFEIAKIVADGQPHAAVARAAAASAKRAAGPQPIRQSISRAVPREIRSAERILSDDAEAFRLTARPLRRVEITNFRALRDLKLEFGEPGSERAPWLMLLGENATGKSTVLQAIALALAGADEARRFTRPSKLLSVGAFEGSVIIWFWDQDAPVEFRFRRSDGTFDGTRGPSAIVLAYGALRYAERRPRGPDLGLRFSRIGPILQPIARVAYPGRWLLDLDDARFDTAARAMQSILPIDTESIMFRSGNRIFFDIGGHRASLGELSAGYQTVVGMCADIMRHLFERWDTLSSASGIVLIDEIDAHLHPRWAMRIVGALREAFPQVQFVASTHDPLALRGLRNGEVALLRRDGTGAVVADQKLPPLEGMQVDQLLTSRVFGLESTIDPETEALLNEYYHLRSLPPEPTRLARIDEIRGRVSDREALGRSESERLMIEVTSEFLRATEEEIAAAPALRVSTLRQLREIADRGASRRRRRQP
ncbi:AAA family ATPase [Ensifer sp. NPDC090286]|uniref:AAA family ATPase n=1 Tax=Ensifer sp. NPDC090286 TaxID=3363991 RepID=UPI00383A7EF7